ncbi:hypothetical protein [Micromonospora craniellae]|uniref:Uncharacterized protein n=1 Tax=Micromonospora craniellae TaxID=2294034 RepID=A0A372FY30_9ACTN|nr:hypothetical protein [Micromonospora craniellae]QOC91495.1 hypothetical protein ID554_26595 [Micromonospora craniellae]RFS45446.1 hypothetical protein D0Q02_16245 [Micromonospora craniellae]
MSVLARSRTATAVARRSLALFVTTALAATIALTATAAPASAAVPDRWGFAYLQTPTPAPGTILDTSRQWGGWKTSLPGAWATVDQIGVGRYRVYFPATASTNGVAHVTAVDNAPRWCQVAATYPFGADQAVEVQCYRPGGGPDNARFVVDYSTSSGLLPPGSHAFGYVRGTPPGGMTASFNSAGAANTVAHLGTGIYEVRLNGLSTTALSGNLQATAEHPNLPRRCKIARWGVSGGAVLAYVFCFDPTGAHADSWFNLTYHRERPIFGAVPPKHFAYVWSPGLGGPTDFNSAGGVNSIMVSGVGQYLVTLPLVGYRMTTVQVTAFGPTPDYCNLQTPWILSGATAIIRNVICFNNAGAQTANQFLLTYSSNV